MADENLKYVIEARDTASKKVRALRRELVKLGGPGMVKSQNEIRKLTRNINQLSGGAKKGSMFFSRFTAGIALGNLAAMAAAKAFGILNKGLRQIKDAVLVAARTEVLNTTLRQMGDTAGYSTRQIAETKNAIIALGITEGDAIAIQQRFIQAQLDIADATKIARLAQDAAVIANTNSSEAALAITNAINKGRPIILKQFGIMVNMVQVNKAYAKQLGKTSNELTAAEKKQALLNAVLEQGESLAGNYEAAMRNVGKQLTSLPRHFQAAQVAIGEHFLPALGGAVTTAKNFLVAIKEIFQSTEKATEQFFASRKAMEASNVETRKLITSYTELKGKANLSNVEHKKLSDTINTLSLLFPGAITKWNAYGEAIGLSTKEIERQIEQKRALFRVQEGEKIKEWISGWGELDETIAKLNKTRDDGRDGVVTMMNLMDEEGRFRKVAVQGVKLHADELAALTVEINDAKLKQTDYIVALAQGVDAGDAARLTMMGFTDAMIAALAAYENMNREVERNRDALTQTIKPINDAATWTAKLATTTNQATITMANGFRGARAEAVQYNNEIKNTTITARSFGQVATQAFQGSASSARSFIDALSSGEGTLRTFLNLMSNILNFIPGGGVFGAVAGGLGALFDDPVNDMNLVKETRRIGAFVARGIAQAIPDFSASDRVAPGGGGVTNIMNVTITAVAESPLDLAKALEELSVDGFTSLEVANG